MLFSHSSRSTNAAFGTPGDQLSTRYRWVPLRKINFLSITIINIGASLGWSLVILIDQHWGMIWDDLNGVTMYFPDCVRLGHGHSVFVRQLGLHRLPGLHGPNSLSSGRYYVIKILTLLLHGNPRTSISVQLCCSPLVWWLLPLRSAAPSSSFLVSLTGKSITV